VKKKFRQIEMGVCFSDETWSTYLIKIPAETPTSQIEKVGRTSLISDLNWTGNNSIVHIFLYSELDSEC